MSLAPVGVMFPPLRSGSRDAGADSDSSFLDLFAAAVAAQAQSTQAVAKGVNEAFATLGALTSAGHDASQRDRFAARTPTEAPTVSSLAGVQPIHESLALTSSDPAGAAASLRKPDHASQTLQSASDSMNFVTHGTLPVIVAGQLVELTVLSERKPFRDSASRRMSMSLDSGAYGSLTVKARVDADCLIVSFEGPAAVAIPARESYVSEVEALAKRIGWQFGTTRVEDAV